MKRKLLLRTLACCMTSCLLAGTSMARQASTPGSADTGSTGRGAGASQLQSGSSSSSSTLSPTGSQTGTMGSQKPERLSQLMGASVKGQNGETLGQINDFIVQPTYGRIQFAVISLSDQSGKLTAVPWQLVQPGTDPTSLTLNVDKQKLSSAQTFDASSWPDFSQPGWSHTIYSYYGIQPGRMGGHVPMGGSESGGTSGQQPGTSQQPGSTYPK